MEGVEDGTNIVLKKVGSTATHIFLVRRQELRQKKVISHRLNELKIKIKCGKVT